MNRLCTGVPDIVGKHLPQPELARRHRALAPITPYGHDLRPEGHVVYLAEARHVTGEVLHVDDGAHVGRWYAEKVRSWAVQSAATTNRARKIQ